MCWSCVEIVLKWILKLKSTKFNISTESLNWELHLQMSLIVITFCFEIIWFFSSFSIKNPKKQEFIYLMSWLLLSLNQKFKRLQFFLVSFSLKNGLKTIKILFNWKLLLRWSSDSFDDTLKIQNVFSQNPKVMKMKIIFLFADLKIPYKW